MIKPCERRQLFDLGNTMINSIEENKEIEISIQLVRPIFF